MITLRKDPDNEKPLTVLVEIGRHDEAGRQDGVTHEPVLRRRKDVGADIDQVAVRVDELHKRRCLTAG